MPGLSITIAFVQAGECPVKLSVGESMTLLNWKLQVNLDDKLVFPTEIIKTNLRSDLILWSSS